MDNRPTYEELEQKVLSLEKELSEHKQAEEAMLEKERLQGVVEMAGAICHELNQPGKRVLSEDLPALDLFSRYYLLPCLYNCSSLRCD